MGAAFCYYGTVIALARIFGSNNEGNNNNNGGVSFDYSALFISSLAELVGTMLVISTVDKVGRVSPLY